MYIHILTSTLAAVRLGGGRGPILGLGLPAAKEPRVGRDVDHDDLDGGDDDGEERDEDDDDAHAEVVLARLAHARALPLRLRVLPRRVHRLLHVRRRRHRSNLK